MTTPNGAKEAIYARFLAQFTEVAASKVAFDNEEFEQPSDEWVRLAVRLDQRAQNTLGKATNRKFRSRGSIFVQCFTRTNTGTSRADTIAKAAGDVFEGEGFSGVDCYASVIRETGPKGKWYMVLVEVEFDFYETK